MNSRQGFLYIAAVSFITLAPMAVAVGQSSVAVSPFVSYVRSAATNPLAGMALTFGGTTGLALRGSADMSISNPDKTASSTGTASTGGIRPWGADADAILFLGGIGGGVTTFNRSLAPYVFSGIGLSGGDSAGSNVVHNGWSYGAGAAIPLGLDADLFGEARWRMSQYVLPTSKMAPSPTSELRFGLSFHVGGSSREPAPAPTRRRGRYGRFESNDEDVVVVAPAAPVVAPVIVTEPAPTVAMTPSVDEVVVQEPVAASSTVIRSTRRAGAATISRRAVTITRSAATMRRSSRVLQRSRGAAQAQAQARTRTQVQTQTSTSTSTRTRREPLRRRR